MRLDFFHQCVELTDYDGEKIQSRIVSAYDVAKALAIEISLGSGFLPANTLFWRNTRIGAVYAIYEAEKTRVLSVQADATKPVERYKIPLPGFIFLCTPGRPPWVYAVKSKPKSERDKVYKAPLFNTYQTGYTCGGTNKYPKDIPEIITSFFASYFTLHLAMDTRIKSNIKLIDFWKTLVGLKKFPLNELVEHGTVSDLMDMDMERGIA